MNELGRRVIVALIGAPIALAVIWWGDAALATLAGMLAALSALEFFRLAEKSGSRPMTAVGVVCAALVPLVVHAHFLGYIDIPPSTIVLPLLALIALAIWTRGVSGQPLAAIATTVMGVLYTGATLSYIYALRYFGYAVGDRAGALVVMLPVLLTWASDIGAYFAGRAIGGPKLIPTVSPGKTIAGAVGGLCFTIMIAIVFVKYALRPYAQLGFSPLGVVLFGACIIVAAQVGDLAESLL